MAARSGCRQFKIKHFICLLLGCMRGGVLIKHLYCCHCYITVVFFVTNWNITPVGGSGGRGGGMMQVGSMKEESQVRGCYNLTFIYNQPGSSVGSPLKSDTWAPRQQLKTT